MILVNIGKIEVSDDSDGKINRSEKSKYIKRKNRKMTKYKILVRSKNHDLFFESKNIEIKNKSGIFIVKARLSFTKLK